MPSDGELVPTPDSEHTRLGCFHKRCGKLLHTWKRRWATIGAGSLRYYADASCTELRCSIPLEHTSVAAVTFEASQLPRGVGPRRGFRLNIKGSKALLGFPAEAGAGEESLEAAAWVALLQSRTDASPLAASIASMQEAAGEGTDFMSDAETLPPTARVSQRGEGDVLARTVQQVLTAELEELEFAFEEYTKVSTEAVAVAAAATQAAAEQAASLRASKAWQTRGSSTIKEPVEEDRADEEHASERVPNSHSRSTITDRLSQRASQRESATMGKLVSELAKTRKEAAAKEEAWQAERQRLQLQADRSKALEASLQEQLQQARRELAGAKQELVSTREAAAADPAPATPPPPRPELPAQRSGGIESGRVANFKSLFEGK